MRLLVTTALLAIIVACANCATVVTVSDTAVHTGVKRLGINIGGRSAGDYNMKNLIDNPGFEAREKGINMLADTGCTTSLFIQALWKSSNFNPAPTTDFYTNSTFFFLTGANQGQSGKISSFRVNGNNLEFGLSPAVTSAPVANDVIVIYKKFAPTFTYVTDARPGSPGVLSRKINSTDGVSFTYDLGYRDADYNAGTLLLINGAWQVSFWAKGPTAAGEDLTFTIGRETWNGGKTFFTKKYNVTNQWVQYTDSFTINPADNPGVFPTGPCTGWPSCGRPGLVVSWSKSSGTYVQLDDVSVSSATETNPTAFTDKFVSRLKEFNGGVLRFWGGQLGASFDNQIATEFARATNGNSPTDFSLGGFPYSLHEFLALCKEVGADPYYVIPPTFFPAELTALIEYLGGASTTPYGTKRANLGQSAAWTTVFDTIYLEFGNEIWGGGGPGDPFAGSSIGGTPEGKAGNFSLGIIRQSPYFNSANFKLLLGGQAGWSGQNNLIEAGCSNHDIMPLAPYFGNLASRATIDDQYHPLYAFPVQERTSGVFKETQDYITSYSHSTKLGIYEINFGYTDGSASSAPPSVRNPWMTGVAGGLALPWSMLQYLVQYNAQPMCAFSILQYSFLYNGGLFPNPQCSYPACSFANIWGMLRDLNGLGTRRPTWIATALVNKGIFPTMITTTQSGDNPSWSQSAINDVRAQLSVTYVNSIAFSSGTGTRSVILFNFNMNTTLGVTINTPNTPAPAATLYQLTSANPTDGNEVAQNVNYTVTQVNNFASGYGLNLPPFSLSILIWNNAVTPTPTPSTTATATSAPATTATTGSATTASATSGSATTAAATTDSATTAPATTATTDAATTASATTASATSAAATSGSSTTGTTTQTPGPPSSATASSVSIIVYLCTIIALCILHKP